VIPIIEKLLIVQEKDCRIRQMEKELKDIPTRKKEELARLDRHKKAVEAAKEQAKVKQTGLKKLEGEADGRREKITKLRQQQMELKTNKEFKAMEDEIKGVSVEIAKIEDQEIVILEEQEKARHGIAEAEAALKEEDATVQADVKALDERAVGMERELADARAARRAAAQEIDPRWMVYYDRVFAARDKALVPLEDGICGGCHMKLPPAVVHDVRKQADMVTCGYCGRLLY
jgi:predicted  nucleic acid-binding Zn-ribbon protein